MTRLRASVFFSQRDRHSQNENGPETGPFGSRGSSRDAGDLCYAGVGAAGGDVAQPPPLELLDPRLPDPRLLELPQRPLTFVRFFDPEPPATAFISSKLKTLIRTSGVFPVSGK